MSIQKNNKSGGKCGEDFDYSSVDKCETPEEEYVKPTEQSNGNSEVLLTEPAIVVYDTFAHIIYLLYDRYEYSCHFDDSINTIELVESLQFEKKKMSTATFVRKHKKCLSSTVRILICFSLKAMTYIDVYQWSKKILQTDNFRIVTYLELISLADGQLNNHEDNVNHLQFQNEHIWYNIGDGVSEIMSHEESDNRVAALIEDSGTNNKVIASDDDFRNLFFTGGVTLIGTLLGYIKDALLLMASHSKISVGLIDSDAECKKNKINIRRMECYIDKSTTIPTKKSDVFDFENKYDLIIECDGQWAVLTREYIIENLQDDDLGSIEVIVDVDGNNKIELEFRNKQSQNMFKQNLGELVFKDVFYE